MSGYHHTLRFTRSGYVVGYRPPAEADELDFAAVERVRAALPGLLAEPTDSLSATVPLPTVGSHGFDWFGTGDGKSQPSS